MAIITGHAYLETAGPILAAFDAAGGSLCTVMVSVRVTFMRPHSATRRKIPP